MRKREMEALDRKIEKLGSKVSEAKGSMTHYLNRCPSCWNRDILSGVKRRSRSDYTRPTREVGRR